MKFVDVPLLLFAATAAVGASGVATFPASDFQDWNELDISASVTDAFDVTLVSKMRLSSEIENPARYAFGSDFKFRVSKHVILTPSYYYYAFRTSSGAFGHGHAPILAVTFLEARERWLLSDRSRFVGELSVTGKPDLWVYRNQPRVDRSFGPEQWSLSGFLWDEIFYYSAPDDKLRNRIAAGIRKGFSRTFAINLYYQRQNDNQSRPGNISTVGVLLEARLR